MTAKSREIMDVSFLSKNVQHFSHTTHTHTHSSGYQPRSPELFKMPNTYP